jgi:hypothetical protein
MFEAYNPWPSPPWPEMIDIQTDLSPSDWICSSPSSDRSVLTVGDLVPGSYPAYARVLHPATRDGWHPAASWQEVTAWSGRVFHPLMQFDFIRIPYHQTPGQPPFADPPPRGSMFHDTCKQLFGVLAMWSTTPHECWLGLWDGDASFNVSAREIASLLDSSTFEEPVGERKSGVENRDDRDFSAPKFECPDRKYFLAKSPIGSICRLGVLPLDITPNLVWPEDHSWVTATDTDLDSTVIACSESCAADLCRTDGLEVVRVNSTDRLDRDGDTINAAI